VSCCCSACEVKKIGTQKKKLENRRRTHCAGTGPLNGFSQTKKENRPNQ
jgi:hypothetical protein